MDTDRFHLDAATCRPDDFFVAFLCKRRKLVTGNKENKKKPTNLPVVLYGLLYVATFDTSLIFWGKEWSNNRNLP